MRGLTLIGLFVALLSAAMIVGCGGGLTGFSTGASPTLSSPTANGVVSLPAQTVTLADLTGTGAGRTVSLPAVTVAPGQSFTYAASVSDLTGVAGGSLTLTFDKSVIACSGATPGSVAGASAQVAKNTTTPGMAAVAIASTTAAQTGPGTLATFQMKALPTATAQNTTVTLGATLVNTQGKTIGRVAGASVAASADVTPQQTGTMMIGDLMGTGLPDVGSAIKILRVVVGLDAPPSMTDMWMWDCNFSGAIEVGDAIKILRCVVGLDPWPITGGNPPPAGPKLTLSLDSTLNNGGTVKAAAITTADLLSTAGAVLKSATVSSTAQFDMSGLAAGDYFIRVNGLADDLVPTRLPSPVADFAQSVGTDLNVSTIGLSTDPTYKIETFAAGQAEPTIVKYSDGTPASPARYAYVLLSLKTSPMAVEIRTLGTGAMVNSWTPSGSHHSIATWLIGSTGHSVAGQGSCGGCHGNMGTKPMMASSCSVGNGWCYKCHYGTAGAGTGMVDPAL